MGREGNIFGFEYVYLGCWGRVGDMETVGYMGLQLRKMAWAGGVVWGFIIMVIYVQSSACRRLTGESQVQGIRATGFRVEAWGRLTVKERGGANVRPCSTLTVVGGDSEEWSCRSQGGRG